MSEIGEKFISKKVILRTYSAGVHYGELSQYDPSTGTAVLKNARRLWRWHVAKGKGISLSEVALHGLKTSDSKICEAVSEMIIAEVIEVIPCSEEASKSIESVEVYTP